MSAPFWKADPAVWPLIAEGLAKPWAPEVAREDLRWWVDQLDVGRARALPGRPALAARWGWKDCAVRKLLAEVDPLGQRSPRQPDASATPAGRQRHASRTPAPERVDAENQKKSASATPAPRQPDASATPAGRHTRGVDRAPEHQSTEHRAQETIPGLPAPDEQPPAGVTARRLLSEQAAPVFAAYRAHHPQKPPHPTAREKKAIEDRLREVVATRGQHTTDAEAVASAGLALIAIVEWAHEAPDAEFYREKKALGLESPLLKADKFADRLERALAWHAAGRPLARGSPASARASPSTGGSWMDDLRAFREPEKPPRKRIDPDHPLPEEPPWPM